ncbi:MAG: hypothetical protein K6G52_03265, partial [Treponemataceae bacterium]|nr:hypothetical protein [Treponemataceae bacterium]
NSFGGWDFLVGGILDAGVQVQIDLDTCVPGISISYDIDLVGPEVTYIKHGLKISAMIGF